MLAVEDAIAGGEDSSPVSADYYDYESPLPFLDDNGFPAFESLPSELEDEDNAENAHRSNGNGIGAEEESFASDFYRCGSDWSSLLSEDKNSLRNIVAPSERKLKQTDLFQSWGLKKPHLSTSKSHDAYSFPPPPNIIGESNSSGDFVNRRANSKASRGERKRSAAGSHNPPRVCPFYKKIPALWPCRACDHCEQGAHCWKRMHAKLGRGFHYIGTPFTVDAFRYGHIAGCSAYFLTHFHSDHYGGLSKRWSHGPIYCTPLTARLLRLCLSVNPSFIRPLELNTEHVIEGIRVTILEANHCPGAALIHFRLPNAQCYLHTGDFRACKLMQSYPLLINQRVNVLYLDTTYCNPKYKFPSKEDVLSFVVRVTKNWLKKQPRTLVVVGAYSIGKECVYLAISKALGVKIYANASRRRILQSFVWPELSGNLCSQGKDAPLHVLPISHLRFETLKDYLKAYMDQYAAVLAFRPTGWTYSEKTGNQLDLIKPSSKGNVTIYGVPYSEHSSFTELQEFIQFLRPDKIIPTVNVGNATNRDKMQSFFREWLKG